MIQTSPLTHEAVQTWHTVCPIDRILSSSGVCALVHDEQVAVFRVGEEVFALSNFDPFSQAYVLSRGIIGDRKGILKVASPVYKQNFCLRSGRCLDDESVSVKTYPVRVENGQVQIGK